VGGETSRNDDDRACNALIEKIPKQEKIEV
jgi:hypothetical protein